MEMAMPCLCLLHKKESPVIIRISIMHGGWVKSHLPWFYLELIVAGNVHEADSSLACRQSLR